MKIKDTLQPILMAASISVFTVACGGSDSVEAPTVPPVTDNGFDKATLVAHLTNNVITPRFENFSNVATQLETSFNDYCTLEQSFNLGNATQEQRDTQRGATQNSWRDAIDVWQMLEVLQIGPLLDDQSSLRNKIYSWPVVNTCAVDQDVVFFNDGEINAIPYDINNRVVTRRGFDALEYLVFNDDLNHSCTSTTAPIGWDILVDSERRELRCKFASEVARDITVNAEILLNGWNGSDGYAQSLLNAASQAGSDFTNVHEALNRISDALFYIDKMTKDAKLGIPLGVFDNSCQQNTCPEDLESQFAFHSLDNIRNNLLSLKSIFTGEISTHSDSHGFDDFLIEEGAQATATNIINNIDASLADIDAYQMSLNETLQIDVSQVQATHAAVKLITDTLKTDFITQLALELPASTAGDND